MAACSTLEIQLNAHMNSQKCWWPKQLMYDLLADKPKHIIREKT